jgi:energy-coupling factor transport system ATP-binding protein
VADWLDDVDRVVVLAPGGGVVADGSPGDVLDGHGARLARQGVWVPRFPPTVRPRARARVADPVLVASGLAAGRPGNPRPVVQALDLTLSAGVATCVTGPNGAGKTTLAHVIGGLVPPARGTLRATARLARGLRPEPHRWRPRELVTRVGSVFQEPQHQFVAGTVVDELAVGPRQAGRSRAQARALADELLERLDLVRLARANPFTLSGGEQRRLSVATALATRPDVLVLDEPTFGQDPRTWAELVLLLVELLEDGVCVAAVTHDRALVDVLADAELVLGGPGSSKSGDPVGHDAARAS